MDLTDVAVLTAWGLRSRRAPRPIVWARGRVCHPNLGYGAATVRISGPKVITNEATNYLWREEWHGGRVLR
jgi:hypothetical protein